MTPRKNPRKAYGPQGLVGTGPSPTTIGEVRSDSQRKQGACFWYSCIPLLCTLGVWVIVAVQSIELLQGWGKGVEPFLRWVSYS